MKISTMIEATPVDAASALESRFLTAFDLNRSHILNGRGQALAPLRDRSIEEFGKLGFPPPKSEAWKYTPIAKALAHSYHIAVAPESPPVSHSDVKAFLIDGLDAEVVVLINGVLMSDSAVHGDDQVVVKQLLDATDDPRFLECFAARTRDAEDAFTALNTAFARHGLFVRVSNGGHKKLHIVNISTGDQDLFLQPRHLFLVDDSSQLTVVESHVSLGDSRFFVNAVAEAFVAERARFDYYRLQDDSRLSGVTNTFVHQKASSYSSCTTVTLAGDMLRNNVNVLPDDEFCESHLVGLFVCQGNMHVDNHTLVDHAKPDCFSNELYKGILDDHSRGVFNGKVLVRPDAQRTNAYQSNKCVVLSESASMNAKPELEIYADDVKCSHGATTGRIDSEALFYLKSRGLSEQRARTILLLAFARDVLDNIRNESLREWLDTKLASRLK